jgi:flagellar hook-basal body complex protein FliE
MTIQPINSNPIPVIPAINPAQKPSASNNVSQITQTFGDMLNSLNQSQQNSDALVQKMVNGLHTVMIGMEENNVNFNVALGIRDKLVDAYREVMRMSI